MNDELTPDSAPPGGAASHAVAAAHDANATPPPGRDHLGPETEPPPAPGPATAGGMIREARQSQGIDLASLAAMLKIPLRRLEALEDGRHDELQGPTFERALAQAACRVLKVDPKPVLALLPRHANNTLESVTDGINTPFRDGHGGGGFEMPQLLRPWVFAVVVLVAAALALFLVPEGWFAHVTRPLVDGLSSSAPASQSAASASAAEQVAAAARELAASDVSPDEVNAAASPTAASGAAPAGAAASGATSPAAVSAIAAQGVDDVLAHVAEPSIPLQVIATEDSWVEVVDAKGHTLLSRTVVAGESVGLDGAMPMHVKIGNAAGTRLNLRGEPVDLAPWNRDNVARLQVK